MERHKSDSVSDPWIAGSRFRQQLRVDGPAANQSTWDGDVRNHCRLHEQ
jgi:hypothetical protein